MYTDVTVNHHSLQSKPGTWHLDLDGGRRSIDVAFSLFQGTTIAVTVTLYYYTPIAAEEHRGRENDYRFRVAPFSHGELLLLANSWSPNSRLSRSSYAPSDCAYRKSTTIVVIASRPFG